MEVKAYDIPEMYSEVLARMKVERAREDSRNGEVWTVQEPVTVTVRRPMYRVLVDEERNCNPFFHVMEFVWMMAGRKDADWIRQFNSRFKEYADEDGTIHGAYGYRWLRHNCMDQVSLAVAELLEDRNSRRAVLAMWDAGSDLHTEHNDLPCNTHIYLRRIDNSLDMTVCNRSNDVVWGMCGANAVHMTMLHELIARAVGLRQGRYHVVTNNAHVYVETHGHLFKGFAEPEEVPGVPDPLLESQERWTDFMADAVDFCNGKFGNLRTVWMSTTALPMYETYLNHEDHHRIKCPQWQFAANKWLLWNRD